MKQFVPLNERSKILLEDYANRHALSARVLHRTCKVARTIADLHKQNQVNEEHVSLALMLQQARWIM